MYHFFAEKDKIVLISFWLFSWTINITLHLYLRWTLPAVIEKIWENIRESFVR